MNQPLDWIPLPGVHTVEGVVRQCPELCFSPSGDLAAASRAVRLLVHEARDINQRLDREVEEAARNTGEWAGDYYADRCHDSVFASAVLNHAVAAALTTLFESVLSGGFAKLQEICALQALQQPGDASANARWRRSGRTFWDPRIFIEAREPRPACSACGTPGAAEVREASDLLRGSQQLLDALSLRGRFPSDLPKVLAALIAYRNAAVHSGCEWSEGKLASFTRRISDEGWPPEWFIKATQGSDPWVYYLSDSFVDLALECAASTLDAFPLAGRDLWTRSRVSEQRPRGLE